MSTIRVDKKTGNVMLSNTLVQRVIATKPFFASISIASLRDNIVTTEHLRAIAPEASLTIDGIEYTIGGTSSQQDNAFVQRRDQILAKPLPSPFIMSAMVVRDAKSDFFGVNRVSSKTPRVAPTGKSLCVTFKSTTGMSQGLVVDIRYSVYDGIPAIEKNVTLRNTSSKSVTLNTITFENLKTVEPESVVDPVDRWIDQSFTVISDFMFHGMNISSANKIAKWVEDRTFTTQVNYELKTPCQLICTLPNGPNVTLAPTDIFVAPRAILVVHDDTNREKRGLAIRQTWRTLAPWITENPLMLHLTSTNEAIVKTAINQCHETGFEMVIFSFGSGLNMEDVSPLNIQRFKRFADYAHSKGIRIGGYSLLASRSVSLADDVINPKTGTVGGTIFGNSPCLGSSWGLDYFVKIKTFLTETGFDLLEHDGSYPGDSCASTRHPGHKGVLDSQWRQFELIRDLYQWCRTKNIYLNVPDTYFLCGSNKVGMGYRETNWSLPRALQHVHARQNMFDGTWEKTPSMGWMFVPLVEYQGGGAAATIEPLKDHLDDYRRHMENCFGYGVQACFRGSRLYDSPVTKRMVSQVVHWYKANRKLLESDIVHIKRPDGDSIDAILHVDPSAPNRQLLVVYNPTELNLSTTLFIPNHFSTTRPITVAQGLRRTKVPVKVDGSFPVVVHVRAGCMISMNLLQS